MNHAAVLGSAPRLAAATVCLIAVSAVSGLAGFRHGAEKAREETSEAAFSFMCLFHDQRALAVSAGMVRPDLPPSEGTLLSEIGKVLEICESMDAREIGDATFRDERAARHQRARQRLGVASTSCVPVYVSQPMAKFGEANPATAAAAISELSREKSFRDAMSAPLGGEMAAGRFDAADALDALLDVLASRGLSVTSQEGDFDGESGVFWQLTPGGNPRQGARGLAPELLSRKFRKVGIAVDDTPWSVLDKLASVGCISFSLTGAQLRIRPLPFDENEAY